MGWKNVPLLWFFHHIVKSAAALPGGALSDRHSRAVVVSAGWAAYALTYVGFGFANAPWQIVVLFLAYALYHGLAEGAERAIIADLAEQGGRGRAFGLYHGFVGVAGAGEGRAVAGAVGVAGGGAGAGAPLHASSINGHGTKRVTTQYYTERPNLLDPGATLQRGAISRSSFNPSHPSVLPHSTRQRPSRRSST